MNKSKKKAAAGLDLQNENEILHAIKIEECQSAIYHVIKELVEKHGRETVCVSMEWIMDKLKVKDEVDKDRR